MGAEAAISDGTIMRAQHEGCFLCSVLLICGLHTCARTIMDACTCTQLLSFFPFNPRWAKIQNTDSDFNHPNIPGGFGSGVIVQPILKLGAFEIQTIVLFSQSLCPSTRFIHIQGFDFGYMFKCCSLTVG